MSTDLVDQIRQAIADHFEVRGERVMSIPRLSPGAWDTAVNAVRIIIADGYITLDDSIVQQKLELADDFDLAVIEQFVEDSRLRRWHRFFHDMPARHSSKTTLADRIDEVANYLTNNLNPQVHFTEGGRSSGKYRYYRIYAEWAGTGTHDPRHHRYQTGNIDMVEFSRGYAKYGRYLTRDELAFILNWAEEICTRTMWDVPPFTYQ